MSHGWTAQRLAEDRIAEIRRSATAPRGAGRSPRDMGPGPFALTTARLLVAAGWRLGGSGALPASLRRRLT
ncbi:MAG TPA: hypothetical protein VMD28_03945 [Acidimicrobiales bacterium]|nr:hypothetical protein [Acidimicrobiales bacterium]